MLNFLLLVLLLVLINNFFKSKSNSKASFSTSTSISIPNSHTMVQVIQSEQEFNDTIKQQNLVVVDFFATWCGPCKMIAPMLEKFSVEYSTATFIKVDVDQLPTVAASQEITSMPTLLFFKNGEIVAKVIGANPGAIKQNLAKFA
ncbi:thioredoxin [Martiniozyma asiatica (nom. inval.)]|nr:thioredoxin [Martiniozyma asiatica]